MKPATTDSGPTISSRKPSEEDKLLRPLHPLAPSANADKHGHYRRELEEAIHNPDINNVALTGHHGSGKSSVLKVFKANFPEKDKILEVSLANFDAEQLDKVGVEREIEKSILQQIFYQVDPEKIPLSKLKRIEPSSFKKRFWIGVETVGYALLGFTSFNFDYIKAHFANYESINNVAVTLFILSSIYVATKFYDRLRNIKLNKMVVQDTELDFSDGKDASPINKHIDEILYLFQSTGHKVLIIEDIDRSKNLHVFEKLRELNTLINKSKKVEQNVTFIYAVKDSFFRGENRTKFFELILPVIPYTNAAGNARDSMVALVREYGLDKNIPMNLMIQTAAFVHDTRLLLNIVNEFIVFMREMRDNKSPNSKDVDAEKLFSMIVYKNFFPQDFEDLYQGKGALYDVFSSNLKKKRENVISTLTTEIEKLVKDIKDSEAEPLEYIKELRSGFLMSLLENAPVAKYSEISFGNEVIPPAQVVTSSERFNHIVESKNLTLQNYQNKGHVVSIPDPKIAEFHRREKAILNKLDDARRAQQEKLEELEYLRSMIHRMAPRELIRRYGDDIIFDGIEEALIEKSATTTNDADERDSKLLVYLVRNGYICSDYNHYISYFHEGGILSKKDQELYRGLLTGQPLEYVTKLDNPAQVIADLPDQTFEALDVLNIQIVDMLLEPANTRDAKKRDLLMDTLSKSTKAMGAFVPTYIFSSGVHTQTLICKLAELSEHFWAAVESEIAHEMRGLIVANLFNGATLEHINKQGDPLRNYIFDGMGDLLHVANFHTFNIELFTEYIVKSSPMVFTHLNIPVNFSERHGRDLLARICKERLYEINSDMLLLIIKMLGNHKGTLPFSDNELLGYAKLCEVGPDCLVQYIDDKIESYVLHVYLPLLNEDIIQESQKSTEALLNHQSLSLEKRKLLLMATLMTFAEPEAVPEDLRLELYFHNKIKPSWTNLAKLVELRDYDPAALTTYLNAADAVKTLEDDDFAAFEKLCDENAIRTMLEEILWDTEVIDDAIKLAAQHYGPIELNPNDEIDEELLARWIPLELLAVTPTNFEATKQSGNVRLSTALLENDFDRVIVERGEYDISTEEMVQILGSDTTSTLQKAKFILNTRPMRLNDEAIAPIAARILSDLPDNNEPIIGLNYLLIALQEDLPFETKLRLASRHITHITDPTEVAMVVEQLGQDFISLIPPSKGGRVNFPNNEMTMRLFKTLEEREIVGKVKEDGETLIINKKTKFPGE